MVRRPTWVLLLVCIIASILSVASPALAAPPSNDAFANAQVISGSSGFAWGSNQEATGETGEPNNAGESAPIQSVWYSWTAPQTAKFFFQTCETNLDTTLGAYTGSAVNSLTKVADNDDACGWEGRSSHIVVSATSGTTYYISVDGWEETTGDFILEWDLANDDFADARAISGESGSIDGRNHGFTGQTGEPDNDGVSAPIESAWYAWTAPKTGRVAFDTCSTTDSSITFPLMDTTLGAYTGSAVNALTLLDDNNDSCGRFDRLSQISFHAQSGSTYYISVDGFDAVPGLFTLTWEFNNDYFDSAHVISGTSGSVSGDNVNYTGEQGEPDNSGMSGVIQSAWYKWTAPETRQISFDTCATEFLNTTLGVYTGSQVNALSVVGDDFETSCPNSDTDQSRVTLTATAGTTYFVSVDSFSRFTGTFTLSWGDPPPSADLSVEISDSRDPVAVGSNIKYRVVVSNAGPDPATNVELVGSRDPSTTFVSHTTSQGSCDAPAASERTMTCSLGTIAAGSSATVTVTVKTTETGDVTNAAWVRSSGADSTPYDRVAEEETSVLESPLADLSVRITDTPDPVPVGSKLKYTIVVSNAGPQAATRVHLQDEFNPEWDENAKFVSFTTSQGSCKVTVDISHLNCALGRIRAGTTERVTLTVRTLQSGTQTNFVRVFFDGGDPDVEDHSGTESTRVRPVNVIRNSGFELDANGNGRPDRWTNDSRFTRQKSAAFSGTFGGRHQASDDSTYTVHQTVPVIPLMTYDFAGWVNIPDTTDDFEFSIQIEWRNRANRLIRLEDAEFYAGPTSGWERVSLEELDTPRGAVKARIRMVVESLNGTIEVDNFWMSR
ncbi:MAG: DUF11 domain-containing protein [Actinomycetota bacterium]|nr:DUF11 domain-containing protein [Actinomycetota bacterium]